MYNYMFAGCSKLKTLDVSHFNTAKSSEFVNMFAYCSSLTELDLGSFDTSNAKYEYESDNFYGLWYMFSGCTNLKTIYVSDKFTTSGCYKGDSGTTMFDGCTSLRGAVEYNANNINQDFANYKTGYFSKAYALVGDTKVPLAGEETFAWELPLVDGCDFTTPEPFTARTATYERNVKNAWSTLCLPYAFTTSTIGADVYAIKDLGNDKITVSRVSGTVEAGTPVLVYHKAGKGTIKVDADNAAVVTAPVNTANALVGTFVETSVPDDDYIIANNKFWLVSDLKTSGKSSDVRTKGLRAYITGSSAHAAAGVLNIVSDETDAIAALNAASDGTGVCYDVQGRRLNGLQKGLNIVKRGGATTKIIIE